MEPALSARISDDIIISIDVIELSDKDVSLVHQLMHLYRLGVKVSHKN